VKIKYILFNTDIESLYEFYKGELVKYDEQKKRIFKEKYTFKHRLGC